MRTVALIVAVLLAIAAGVGVHSYVKRQEMKQREESKEVDIAVAGRHISSGDLLTFDMLEFKPQQARYITNEDITKPMISSYVNRRVERDIAKGTPLKVSHFVSREKPPASKSLSEGKRAITIAVDVTSGVAGLVRPGDNVDIYATTSATKGSGTARTWLVLSQVLVLAVDDRMSETGLAVDSRGLRRGYSNLTVAVASLEAEVLIYLQEQSKLTFALRPRAELGQKEPAPVVDQGNVEKLAQEANAKRQKEIQELNVMTPKP